MPGYFSVYLQYSAAHLHQGMVHLDQLERRIFSNGTCRRIIIDNMLPIGEAVNIDGTMIHGGDNRVHEFSGWETGLKIILNDVEMRDNDVILFSNDSFFRNYDPSLQQHFKRKHVKLTSENPMMTGIVDAFPEPMLVSGHWRTSWVRSNCFLINYGLLKRIGSLLHPDSMESIFSGQVPGFFNERGHLNEKYKAFLRAWLFGDKSDLLDYEYRWYKSAPLTSENISFMTLKAYCILSEHQLSFSVCDHGGRLLDILPPQKENLIDKFLKLAGRLTRLITTEKHQG